VDRLIALQIMESLRQGTVPLEHVEAFSVGRKAELSTVLTHLAETVRDGASHLTFVGGDYGTGKTHFLGLLRTEALRQNLVVSHVVLESRACPLDKVQMIYGAVIRGMNTSQCRDRPAFRPILDAWFENCKKRVVDSGNALRLCRHNMAYEQCAFNCFAELMCQTMPFLKRLSHDLRTVLTAYFHAKWEDEKSLMGLCENWLLGNPLPVTERRRIAAKATEGVQVANITNETALKALGDACRTLQSIGHAGLVIMLDEAEMMPSTTGKGRWQAFINLISLMSACESWDSIYCVYATTPYFNHEFNGMYEQLIRPHKNIPDARKRDIRQAFQDNQVNLSPLHVNDYLELAKRICAIQAVADPRALQLATEELQALVQGVLAVVGKSSPVRRFITELVRRLDARCQA
jgi:hypothetical protein